MLTVAQSCTGEVQDVFTGFIGDGIVEQIEQVSPLWPQRILMGEEDPMLDCFLHDFVSMMQVREPRHCPSAPATASLHARHLFVEFIPHPWSSLRCWMPRTRFMSRARGHFRRFQMVSLRLQRTRSVPRAVIRSTSQKKVYKRHVWPCLVLNLARSG